MKKIATLVLLVIAFNAMSQSTTGSANRWKIGFQFSTDFNKLPDVIGGPITGYSYLKPEGLNFTGGITMQFFVSRKFQIMSAALYSNKDMTGRIYCHVCDLVDNGPVEIQQRYIEIPISVRYMILNKKIDLFTEAGFAGSYRVSDQEIPYSSSFEESNKHLLSAQLGLGCGVDVSNRFNINVSAVYRQSLTNFLDEGDFKRYQSDFKLKTFATAIGVIYSLHSAK
jgi:hypothetical protein